MENQDKIFEQLKQAAENAESKEFPSMESVWSRVEDKLDNKALSKQNKKWKQWAVAASVVAVVSVGYQFFKAEDEKPVQKQEKTLVKDIKPEIAPRQVAIADTTSALKKNAPQILNREQEKQSVVASRTSETSLGTGAASTIVYEPSALAAPSMRSVAETQKEKANAVNADEEKADDSYDFDKRRAKSAMAKTRAFDARIAHSEQESQNKSEKQKPLLIVDGKPLVAKTQREYDQKLAEAMESVPAERDTVFYLKKPLYIIDGKEYSEQSLFGPNPTSPYAPLNLQEEGMKTTVYTGKDAVKRFGDKGKNGVVVVTTKNGKPSERKK